MGRVIKMKLREIFKSEIGDSLVSLSINDLVLCGESEKARNVMTGRFVKAFKRKVLRVNVEEY